MTQTFQKSLSRTLVLAALVALPALAQDQQDRSEIIAGMDLQAGTNRGLEPGASGSSLGGSARLGYETDKTLEHGKLSGAVWVSLGLGDGGNGVTLPLVKLDYESTTALGTVTASLSQRTTAVTDLSVDEGPDGLGIYSGAGQRTARQFEAGFVSAPGGLFGYDLGAKLESMSYQNTSDAALVDQQSHEMTAGVTLNYGAQSAVRLSYEAFGAAFDGATTRRDGYIIGLRNDTWFDQITKLALSYSNEVVTTPGATVGGGSHLQAVVSKEDRLGMTFGQFDLNGSGDASIRAIRHGALPLGRLDGMLGWATVGGEGAVIGSVDWTMEQPAGRWKVSAARDLGRFVDGDVALTQRLALELGVPMSRNDTIELGLAARTQSAAGMDRSRLDASAAWSHAISDDSALTGGVRLKFATETGVADAQSTELFITFSQHFDLLN